MRNDATAGQQPADKADIDLRLHEVTNELVHEFAGRVDEHEVREVVRDSYNSLSAHVRRTTWTYLTPWARSRLLARSRPNGREPSLAEMLAMPANRL